MVTGVDVMAGSSAGGVMSTEPVKPLRRVIETSMVDEVPGVTLMTGLLVTVSPIAGESGLLLSQSLAPTAIAAAAMVVIWVRRRITREERTRTRKEFMIA